MSFFSPMGQACSNPNEPNLLTILQHPELKAFERLRSPVWIYDIQQRQLWWGNLAAMQLWAMDDREVFCACNSDPLEAIQIRLLSYLPQFEQGQTITEEWLLHPHDQPISVQCLCSGIRIDDGRWAVLIEGSINEAATTNTLRPAIPSVEAGPSTAQMVRCLNAPHVQSTETALHQQAEQERLMMAIAQQIHQSLDLKTILQATVTEVQRSLKTDRALLLQFEPDGSGTIVVEAVHDPWLGLQGTRIYDPCFASIPGWALQPGAIRAISNIATIDLAGCYKDLLVQLQVQASLVVPVLQGQYVWGLLIVHQCQAPRDWQAFEVYLLEQLATQVAIAIQQSQLYERVNQLNTGLEQQVQERTAQLKRALEFEALLKRITDKVRDSLDEQQILQTAVRELVDVLGACSCDTALFDNDHNTLTIVHEHTIDSSAYQGQVLTVDELSDVLPRLQEGECLQFCELAPRPVMPHWQPRAILASPIFDDQGVLGDLWLFRPPTETFDELEIRLVQQVANQCGIAIRQARLFQTAQAQVRELERLNRLKDDFLSTVSHELRTPMSNIRLAIQLLIAGLKPFGVLESSTTPVSRYLQVLQHECHREISLINDLLDLSRLDANTEPLMLTTIALQDWISSITEPFAERIHNQQQILHLDLPSEPLPVVTDLSYLERAIAELLNNACKYTPQGERIEIILRPHADRIQICMRNSGVEIAQEECDRIFDKFYRIPNNAPWRYGGTGLGLALVKKLLEQLQGSIEVTSDRGWTTFLVEIPLALNPITADT